MKLHNLLLLVICFNSVLNADEVLIDCIQPDTFTIQRKPATVCSDIGPNEYVPAIKIGMPGMITKEISLPANANRDNSQGLSFLVKGDGSNNWGILFFYAPNIRWGYYYYFPLKNTSWVEFRVAWSDFIGSTPYSGMEFNTNSATKPSDIRRIGFGDFRSTQYGMQAILPHSYSIANLRFTNDAPVKYFRRKYTSPSFDTLIRKLKQGKSVSIGCIGDSITAGVGSLNQPNRLYAQQVGEILCSHFSQVNITSHNRGIGGSGLLDHIMYMERDLDQQYDLVTLLIGYNDVGKVSPIIFEKYLNEWIDRIAFFTKGQTTILLIPPLPALYSQWDRQDHFANIFRKLANERGIAICDIAQIVKQRGHDLFIPLVSDLVHLNPDGQDFCARAISQMIISRAEK